MQASWHALHANLLRDSSTLTFQTHFARLRASAPVLDSFREPAQLLDFLHVPDGTSDGRNAVLAALVQAAQCNDPAAETATVLLLLALWPGLDAVYRRLWRHFRDRHDELVSEIAGRIVIGIRSLDLARVRRIAATLIRNTERDIRRDLARQWTEAGQTEVLNENQPRPEARPLFVGCRLDPVAATRLIELQLREWVGDDAPLIVAIAIEGLDQRAAGERVGLRYGAARKRYQRGLARIRAALRAA